MDSFLRSVKELKQACGIEESDTKFLENPVWLAKCKDDRIILRVTPNQLSPEFGDKYFEHLLHITRDFLRKYPLVSSWEAFSRLPEVRKSHRLLHEFGVRSVLFLAGDIELKAPRLRADTSLTLPELFEVCQIEFSYSGTYGSFTKMIEKEYGSFAEYCVLKGYDINGTRWDNQETAIRVAKKLGSKEAVRVKAVTLFKYLSEKGLIDKIFDPEVG